MDGDKRKNFSQISFDDSSLTDTLSISGHNDSYTWWVLFALPNGFWIVVPGIISIVFARDIATSLRANAVTTLKAKTK